MTLPPPTLAVAQKVSSSSSKLPSPSSSHSVTVPSSASSCAWDPGPLVVFSSVRVLSVTVPPVPFSAPTESSGTFELPGRTVFWTWTPVIATPDPLTRRESGRSTVCE